MCDVPHLQVGDLVIEAEAVDLYRRGLITWQALLDFGTVVAAQEDTDGPHRP